MLVGNDGTTEGCGRRCFDCASASDQKAEMDEERSMLNGNIAHLNLQLDSANKEAAVAQVKSRSSRRRRKS